MGHLNEYKPKEKKSYDYLMTIAVIILFLMIGIVIYEDFSKMRKNEEIVLVTDLHANYVVEITFIDDKRDTIQMESRQLPKLSVNEKSPALIMDGQVVAAYVRSYKILSKSKVK